MNCRVLDHWFCYAVLVFASGAALISGINIMYEHLSGGEYTAAECSTREVKDHGDTPCTYTEDVNSGFQFGKQDKTRWVTRQGSFHCVQVDVTYEDKDGVKRSGTIYEDVSMVSDTNQRCSYRTCGRSLELSNAKVNGFVNKWRQVTPPSSSQCFYNPTNLDQVIDKKPYTFSQALHFVLWPLLIFIPSMLMLVVRLRAVPWDYTEIKIFGNTVSRTQGAHYHRPSW